MATPLATTKIHSNHGFKNANFISKAQEACLRSRTMKFFYDHANTKHQN